MTKYIPLILFTVLTNFCSQITLKHGMTSMSKIELTPSTLLPTLFSVVFNPWVFAGLLLMVISMGAHLVVLSRVEISFAYPFLGLSFVLITMWGYFMLGEDVNVWRMMGVLFICLGVALVARSS
jgi:multidrug transporter EmrE-like cation transporter